MLLFLAGASLKSVTIPSDSLLSADVTAVFPSSFRASTACASSVISAFSGHEFLCGCFTHHIWSVHLLSLWFLAVVRSSSLGAALCSGSEVRCGFPGQGQKLPAVSAFFPLLPVSEKSGGLTRFFSQRFISSWGSVAFLCTNCLLHFAGKKRF